MRYPDLLSRHVPPAWRKHAEMAGVVAMLLSADGCTKSSTDTPPPGPATTAIAGDQQNPVTLGEDSVNAARDEVASVASANAVSASDEGAAWVAPVFHHGEGRGATGCIVVSPPAFLSEEEALQVIIEELKQAGIVVTATNVKLEELSIEQGMRRYGRLRGERLGEPGQKTPSRSVDSRDVPGVVEPLEVDGLNADRRVAFEFISREDYRRFGGLGSMGTVQEYDMPDTAEYLAQAIAAKDDSIHFGTFYDPLTPASDPHRAHNPQAVADARQRSRELLREQVVDFVNWLKAQGAI